MIEDDKVFATFKMRKDLKRDIKVHCASQGIRIEDFVDRVFTKSLKQRKDHVKQS